MGPKALRNTLRAPHSTQRPKILTYRYCYTVLTTILTWRSLLVYNGKITLQWLGNPVPPPPASEGGETFKPTKHCGTVEIAQATQNPRIKMLRFESHTSRFSFDKKPLRPPSPPASMAGPTSKAMWLRPVECMSSARFGALSAGCIDAGTCAYKRFRPPTRPRFISLRVRCIPRARWRLFFFRVVRVSFK